MLRRALTGLAAAALGLSGALVVAAPATAATTPVTLPGDSNSPGTLRYAVNEANAAPGADSITIAAGLTVTLASQLPPLVEGVTVTGGFGTTITQSASFNFISIEPDATKTDQAYRFDNILFQGDAGGAMVGRAITASTNVPFTSLTTNNCSFQGLFATGAGGAIWTAIASGNGPVNLSVTSFGNNGSNTGGGAVSVSGSSSFSMVGNGSGVGSATGNTSSGGGAVFVDRVGAVTIEDMTFTTNTATSGNGGAIVVQRSTSLAITDSKLGGVGGLGNIADASGGALFVSEVPTTTLTTTDFTGNRATTAGGGGIHIESSGALTIDGGQYLDNRALASDGGALRVYGLSGLLSVEGGAAFYSNLGNYGGAIAIVNDTTGGPVQFIEGTTFVTNRANNLGGAIFSSNIGTFSTRDATYDRNEAAWSGGAIWQEDGFSTFIAERTLFTGNHTLGGNGGAIGLEGMPAGDHSFTLRSSTFSENSATGTSAYGGAVVLGETGNGTVVSVDSSTFVDNSVTESDGVAEGAAIAAIDPNSINGRLDIVNSTFFETETEDSPFVIFAQHVGETGLLTVRNTTLFGVGGVLVDDNDGGVQLINSIIETTNLPGVALDTGALVTAQYNLFSDDYDAGVIASAATNRFEVADMKLGALANNGGPTDTRLPADDSPAVNTGNAAIEVDLPTTDQRGAGYPRVFGPALDIGAVEINAPLPATGSTIPLWIPVVGGVILLVGAAAIAFTIVSRRRLAALEAPTAPKADEEPPVV